MNPPIHAWFESATQDGVLTRRMVLEGIRIPGGERAVTWWRFPEAAEVPDLRVVDSLVMGHLLWASTLGQDLVVHGAMSPLGLYNLRQLLEIRCTFTPQRYHPIQIVPDQIVKDTSPAPTRGRTVAAFSGGLDSTFTVVRHARRLVGERSYPLDGLVLVLGFDIPRHRSDRILALRQRIQPLVQSLNLPLHIVETNAGELGGGTWPQSSMPLFGSVLAQCAGRGGVGLVSSGAPYGSAYLAISHIPPLDDLCSHDDFRLVTDGGAFGRTDKLETLLPYPEVIATLRVCWQGSDPSRNCGTCPKCVMTRLNFLAAGVEHPACFDTPTVLEHVAQLPLHSVNQARDFFRFCLVELNARNVQHPVASLLRRRLARVPPDHLAPTLWRWVHRVRAPWARARRKKETS